MNFKPSIFLVLASLMGAILSLSPLRSVNAQVLLTGPYTQNFDALPQSGTFTNNTTVPGWYVKHNGTNASGVTSITGGDGSNQTAGLRSFEDGSDRALGGVRTGTAVDDFYYGVRLKNNTGSTIQSFTIQYTVEQWRQPGNKPNAFINFDYNRTIDMNATAGWNTIAGSDVTWAASSGNAIATIGNTRNVVKSFVANISLNAGEEILFRWKDANTNGYYLALDDIQIVPNVTAAPASIYYSRANGNLNLRGSWSDRADGNGTQPPASGTFANATFVVTNRPATTLGYIWDLGANSKVLIQTGTLTIPSGFTINNTTIDVADNATLQIEGVVPSIGLLGNNSTVIFNNAGVQGVPAKTYGNVVVASDKTLTSGTIVVNGAFSVNSGKTFSQSGGTLNIGGSLNASTGTYALTGGAVVFDAVSGTRDVPGLTYHNLTIAGSGTANLKGNATVNGVLNLSGAHLIAAAPVALTLGTNATIVNESADHFFKGKLVKSQVIPATGSADFGGMGLTFTKVGGMGNWGMVKVTRTTDAAIVNPKDNTKESIRRSWHIEPQFQAGTNVELLFSWLATEDDGQNYGAAMQAQPWKSTDNGLTWIPVGDLVDINTNNGVRAAKVTTNAFSIYTFSGTNNPLPVSWLNFRGKATRNGNDLIWATASEKNTAEFIVERSENGKTFEAIGKVKAAGNSNQVTDYQFTDKQPTAAITTYYRLKQTDADGAFEYSAIIAVAQNERSGAIVSVYPNPFGQTLNLQLAPGQALSKMIMKSLDGREVYSRELPVATEIVLNDLPNLKAGVYLLQLIGGSEITTLKIMRQ